MTICGWQDIKIQELSFPAKKIHHFHVGTLCLGQDPKALLVMILLLHNWEARGGKGDAFIFQIRQISSLVPVHVNE